MMPYFCFANILLSIYTSCLYIAINRSATWVLLEPLQEWAKSLFVVGNKSFGVTNQYDIKILYLLTLSTTHDILHHTDEPFAIDLIEVHFQWTVHEETT